jgi:imidazolonepropionase-like amidohydrolase
MHRIQAALLIPGRGDAIGDGVVVIDGGAISYAGPAGSAPATPGAHVHDAAVIMPGLWDCHGHFLGTRVFDLGQLPLEPLTVRAARSARDLRAALDAGVTSVREVGGLGVELARVVAEGVLDGPSVYGAGAVLSTTGGHGDLHSYPLSWMDEFSRREGIMALADGPSACARAVREQLRRNARVIKVCASGGVLSEIDHPVHQQFTDAELRVIVEKGLDVIAEPGGIAIGRGEEPRRCAGTDRLECKLLLNAIDRVEQKKASAANRAEVVHVLHEIDQVHSFDTDIEG